MMRRGYELECEGLKASDLEVLKAEGTKLRVDHNVTEGGVWGGLFGGALLIIGAQDGSELDKPLNGDNVHKVRYLNVVDRRFAWAHSYYNNPLEANYGEVETYSVSQSISSPGNNPVAQFVVHESRCLRWDGARTDILTRNQLAGWSWSLLQRPYEVLRAFDAGFQACANLMSDASQAVFKLQNLIQMIASGQKDVLQSRMALVDMSRSSGRAVLIDAEKEEFKREPTTFTGLPDLLDRFMMRLSAAVGIPVTILLGRSAAGMNATGDADFRMFYDKLATEQERELGPKLVKIYQLIGSAKDSELAGKDLSKLKVKFKPLWQPSDKEQSEVELNVAQKDQIYFTMGALNENEIALSRWGSGNFSAGTTIDVKQRESDMQQDKLFAGTGIQKPSDVEAKDPNAPKPETDEQGKPLPQAYPGSAVNPKGVAGAPQPPKGTSPGAGFRS
jgi:phage-related protein (TIGR01555 family)